MPSIKTLQDIKDRCVIDGECWMWAGGLNSHRIPSLRVNGKSMSGGAALYLITTGRPIRKGYNYASTCGNRSCMNKEHRKLLTRKQMAAYACLERTAIFVAKMAKTRQDQSRLTWDDIHGIRAAESLDEAMAKYGVTRTNASKIRLYRSWKPVGIGQLV